MKNAHLRLVYKNDNPSKIKRTDNVFDKDELIAIDRAESIDFSNIEDNKNFVKIDIDEYISSLDDEEKEMFDFVGKIYDIRKRFYDRIKDDILTFTPYIMLLDMAHENLDNQFIEDVEAILNNKYLPTKVVVEDILDILEDYM